MIGSTSGPQRSLSWVIQSLKEVVEFVFTSNSGKMIHLKTEYDFVGKTGNTFQERIKEKGYIHMTFCFASKINQLA